MTVIEYVRHRRAVREHEHTLRTNDALFQAGRDLRRKAQDRLNAGDPAGAQPYLDEAELFESAITRPAGL